VSKSFRLVICHPIACSQRSDSIGCSTSFDDSTRINSEAKQQAAQQAEEEGR
jgi:hypothetical protein